MKNNAVKNGKVPDMALYITAESIRNRLLFDAKTWCTLHPAGVRRCHVQCRFLRKDLLGTLCQKGCPYDVISMFDLPEEQGASMKEGREIIEQYSSITEQIDYKLYSPGETTLCSSIPGYVEIGWTDKFMPLSQFNTLLTDCGYDPVTLENQHLMITPVQEISNRESCATRQVTRRVGS